MSYKVNNLLDILLETQLIKARNQGGDFQAIEGPIDQYYGEMAQIVSEKIMDAELADLTMTDDQAKGIVAILGAAEACMKKNDPKSLVQIIEKLRNSGEDGQSSLVETKEHDDPRCQKLNHRYLWWDFTVCIPKFECITGYAEITRGTMYLGNCKDTGWEECKCIPIGYPLALVIVSIALVGILFSGPAVSAGTSAMMRSIALRLMPAG